MSDYAFTLVESNADYLSGHQRHIYNEDRKEYRVVIVIVALLMAASLFFAWNNWKIEAQYTEHGSETWAQIDSYYMTFVLFFPAAGEMNYHFTANGHTYHDYATLNPFLATPEQTATGQSVKIRYMTNDPSQSEPTSQNHLPLAIFWAIAGILLAIPTALLLSQFRRLLRFEREGKRIQGAITEVKTLTPKASAGKKYVVEMHYTFTAPSGKELTGKAKRRRDDLIALDLLKLEALPVMILYINDRNFLLL